MQGKALQDSVIDEIDDLKNRDIIVLDIQGRSSITDYVIICTGTSSRHVMSTADHVVQESCTVDLLPLSVGGENNANRIVVGLGDVIVRVMQEESHRLCELGKPWSQCMKLQLIVVGTKMPDWIQTGPTEYPRRFPKNMPFELIEIPAEECDKNADIKRILDKEGEQVLATAGKDRIATLDIPGKPQDTPQLAAELECWKLGGRDVSLLIGRPEGSSSTYRAVAEQGWSPLALTLPHPLVRVLITESLYRA